MSKIIYEIYFSFAILASITGIIGSFCAVLLPTFIAVLRDKE